jgi:hypothetical protein
MRRRNPSGNELEIQKLGIDPRRDGFGTDGFALVRLNTDGASILDKDMPHPRRRPDVHAASDGGFRHGLGDGAHSANGMAPDTFLTVHLTKAVVQENIG